ncbi:hypothetical protein [Cupriavidus basilensis]|uniref:hypothetical protein n=1 Tax=Cupriavidus basilensis TaxID=68895 RepID=UPI00157AA3F5|nr:hypothetical protein [Cupriavidus basilensis]NUA28667.1 hypothetical protein [Cupriavidus basilensis]
MTNSKPAAPKSTAPAKKAATNPDTYRLSESVDGIKDGMSNSQMLAALATRGALAPTSIKQFSNCGDELQVSDVLTELQKVGSEVSSGNLERVERLLVNQAITLDTLFHNLLQRAGRQAGRSI